MIKKPRISILDSGIMGSSLALFLARKDADVTLFDKAEKPFSAASRWNEGKIHLGYLYAADTSLDSAEHVMPGGLMFRPLVEELLGTSIEPAVTRQNDIYLCHRNSVVKPDAMENYMRQVTEKLNANPNKSHYLTKSLNAEVRRLSKNELEEVSGSPDIIAGFRVPEYSVETTWIADRFVEVIHAEKRIELQMKTKIESVIASNGDHEESWDIHTSKGIFPSCDYVINALWEGRMAIDQKVGLKTSSIWSNRFRQSLFIRTSEPVKTPCVVIATGPFGDIKNYNDRDFYLSWYPDGLRVDSSDILPPELDSIDMPDYDLLANAIFDHLQVYLPWIKRIRECVEYINIEGGWVFAAGRGQLSDPSSSLHQRSDYGVFRKGSYLSTDTGKYSTAPLLAKSLADKLIQNKV